VRGLALARIGASVGRQRKPPRLLLFTEVSDVRPTLGDDPPDARPIDDDR